MLPGGTASVLLGFRSITEMYWDKGLCPKVEDSE